VPNPDFLWYFSLNELGTERIRQLGEKYQADYLITETINPSLNNIEVVYQNKNYTIYRLK